jgi:phage/plasmid-like protein (TIGR03299 family)
MVKDFSYTAAQMKSAKDAGFESPEHQERENQRQKFIADANRRGDGCEAAIMAGTTRAEDVPLEERRARSKVESMASGRGLTPWHRLPEAKVLDGLMTSVEVLREAGIDWRVEKCPLQIIDEAWRTADEVPSFALVRDKDRRVLGAAGTRYTVVQNETLAEIGEALMKAGARWETAGSLNGGRRVWMLLSLESDGEVVEGDKVKSYILLSNAHDGYRTVDIALTTVRVVCNNSFRLAMGGAGAGTFKFRHTSQVEERLAQAGDILLHARERFDEFVAQSKKMAELKLNEQEQIDFLLEALGISKDPKEHKGLMLKKLEQAKECLRAERAAAAEGVEDSGWTAFNAVTRFTTHKARVMGGDDKQTERRLEAQMWGPNAEVNQNAFEMILEATAATA